MIFFRNLGMHKNRAAHDVCRSADICDRPIFIDMLLLFERFVPLRGCVGQISPSDGRCLPRAGFPSPCGDVLVKYADFSALLVAPSVAFPSPCGDVLVKYKHLSLHRLFDLVSVPLRGCVGQIRKSPATVTSDASFRPLAGMCWSNAYKAICNADSNPEFPSPCGDVLVKYERRPRGVPKELR